MAADLEIDSKTGSKRPRSAAGTALLKKRFAIDFDRPLTHLDSPLAEAYHASDTTAHDRQLFALVCRPDVPQRAGAIAALGGRLCRNSLAIVGVGPLATLAGKDLRYVIVLERPLGGRLLDHLAQRGSKFTEREIARTVLPQLAAALADMGEHGVAHRALRPDNLFYADTDHQQIALGECVSEPAGYSQPSAYETVERAMAMPEGRGEGTIECDYYALGIALFEFLTDRKAGAGQDEDALLMAKITKGSFISIIGKTPLSNPMRELLGGLLCDDPELRWAAEDLNLWQQGGRRSPRAKLRARRAGRPFVFLAVEYRYDRCLAWAFARRPREAAKAIRSEQFKKWLITDLDDIDLAAEVDEAIAAASAGGDDEMVAQTCLVLDADSPIRFQNLSMCVDGFGPVLAAAVAANDRTILASLAALLGSGLPARWVEARIDRHTAVFKSQFVRLQYVVVRSDAGFGIQRCLYELNPSLPCLSPLVAERCVHTINELFTALDWVAQNAAPTADMTDRHIAAFAGSRAHGWDHKFNLLVRGNDDPQHRVNVVEFLDTLQRRGRPRPLPHLSAWLARWLEPAIDSLHSERRRTALKKELASVAGSGDLYALSSLMNSGRVLDRDRAEYRRALAEYAGLERERRRLENNRAALIQSARRTGSGIAALIGYAVFLLSFAYIAFGAIA